MKSTIHLLSQTKSVFFGLRVLEYLLDVTDHRVISECCNPHADLAITEGQHESRWNGNRQESVNIFTLALTYERYLKIPPNIKALLYTRPLHRIECVRVLLRKGLRSDEFPCLWRYRNRPVLDVLGLEYPFATPLSFILSYSPFDKQLLEVLKEFVDKGPILFLRQVSSVSVLRNHFLAGSKTKAYALQFVPPLVALLFAPGWGNLDESSILTDAVNFLIQETDAIKLVS